MYGIILKNGELSNIFRIKLGKGGGAKFIQGDGDICPPLANLTPRPWMGITYLVPGLDITVPCIRIQYSGDN